MRPMSHLNLLFGGKPWLKPYGVSGTSIDPWGRHGRQKRVSLFAQLCQDDTIQSDPLNALRRTQVPLDKSLKDVFEQIYLFFTMFLKRILFSFYLVRYNALRPPQVPPAPAGRRPLRPRNDEPVWRKPFVFRGELTKVLTFFNKRRAPKMCSNMLQMRFAWNKMLPKYVLWLL